MRLVRLFRFVFGLALQRALAHRANLLFEVLQTAVGIGAGVGAVLILFTQVDRLAGWSRAGMIVLYGAYQVVSGLLDTFIEPNFEWFSEKVTGGQLDDMLLQPVPILFTASLGTCRPLTLTQVLLGAGLMLAGTLGSGAPTVGGVLACLLLLAAGTVIAWASRTALASLAFWAPGMDPSVLYYAFWQLGRYPVAIYQPVVRALLTYVVPVAFIATVPARALTQGPDLGLVAGGLAAAALAGYGASLLWRAGLRRYTSATS